MTTGDDERISALRAMAHPVRLRITSLLTGNPMSAAEVARELGLTHANASYHLRRLAEVGELVVDGEEVIRGGVAKRYRYLTQEEWLARAPAGPELPGERRAYLATMHREVERRMAEAPTPTRMSSFDLEGWVEESEWRRAVELLMEAGAILHRANRAPRSAGTVHVSASATAFRMAADADDGERA